MNLFFYLVLSFDCCVIDENIFYFFVYSKALLFYHKLKNPPAAQKTCVGPLCKGGFRLRLLFWGRKNYAASLFITSFLIFLPALTLTSMTSTAESVPISGITTSLIVDKFISIPVVEATIWWWTRRIITYVIIRRVHPI